MGLCDKELKKNTTPGTTFVKTICPVACNNCPSVDNDDAPPKCEDTTSKIKWVDNKGKIKKTSCKTNKKCNKKDVDGNFVWQSCPVKCKKCDKLQELLEEEEKQNEGNGGNNNDNNNVFCKDSTKFLYKNKKEKIVRGSKKWETSVTFLGETKNYPNTVRKRVVFAKVNYLYKATINLHKIIIE